MHWEEATSAEARSRLSELVAEGSLREVAVSKAAATVVVRTVEPRVVRAAAETVAGLAEVEQAEEARVVGKAAV